MLTFAFSKLTRNIFVDGLQITVMLYLQMAMKSCEKQVLMFMYTNGHDN